MTDLTELAPAVLDETEPDQDYGPRTRPLPAGYYREPFGDFHELDARRIDRSLRDDVDTSNISGKKFYDAKTIRDLAHRYGGLVRVELQETSHDIEAQFASFIATAVFRDGTSFQEAGDACPENCGPNIGKHYYRMGATRAISRALNLGMNADANDMSELDGDTSSQPAQEKASFRTAKPSTNKYAKKAPAASEEWE